MHAPDPNRRQRRRRLLWTAIAVLAVLFAVLAQIEGVRFVAGLARLALGGLCLVVLCLV